MSDYSDRDRVRTRAGLVVTDQGDTGLLDVEHGKVAALGRHVQPSESRIDAHDIGNSAGAPRAEARTGTSLKNFHLRDQFAMTIVTHPMARSLSPSCTENTAVYVPGESPSALTSQMNSPV